MEYGFDNGPRYIEREIDGVKTKIFFTWEDTLLLEKQEWYSLAVNAIENYCEDPDAVLGSWSEEALLELGEALNERLMRDCGDKEWDVLDRFGLIEYDDEDDLEETHTAFGSN